NASANIQDQLNNKMSSTLATDHIFKGVGGVATASTDLPTGITIGGAAIYRASGADVSLADGGTGASLADPGADRIMFWDDSAGQVTWLEVGSGLTLTGTTLSASGGVTSVDVSGGTTGLTTSGGPITSSGTITLSGTLALANGGTGASLSDPNADRIMFWDDSAGAVIWLEVGSGLSINGTTITGVELIDEDDMASDSDTKAPTQQSVKAYVDSLVPPTIASGTFTPTVSNT